MPPGWLPQEKRAQTKAQSRDTAPSSEAAPSLSGHVCSPHRVFRGRPSGDVDTAARGHALSFGPKCGAGVGPGGSGLRTPQAQAVTTVRRASPEGCGAARELRRIGPREGRSLPGGLERGDCVHGQGRRAQADGDQLWGR